MAHEIDMKKYKIRTDMIVESFDKTKNITGINHTVFQKENNITVEKTIIDETGEKTCGKKKGIYQTISFDDITDKDNQKAIEEVLISVLKEFLEEKKINKSSSCLVIGLGNKDSTPDSLGPLVVNDILVTKYLFNLGEVEEGYRDVSSFIPGVTGTTGIETVEILKGIVQHIGSKENHIENLTLEDETVYKLKIDPVYLQNSKNAIIGSIINIENITEIVKLENMRRDFVANVSHELKTPLTSINGFVETLIMNEDLQVSKRNRFLAIIQKESDRLKRLIEDILLLSSIENKNDLVKESISLYDVFKEVYDMINYIASSKNIDLSYEFEDDKVVVQAYGDYMKQLLLNLIDNAIKWRKSNS